MDPQLLERLGKELREERANLTDELRSLGADPDSEKVERMEGVDDNFADTAQSTVEREQVLRRVEQARGRLVDVDVALGRMEEGTYGTCIVGGEPIPEARLEARPTSVRCVEHAS